MCPLGVQMYDNQRERGQGCMGNTVRSGILISKWKQELQLPCDGVYYNNGEELLGGKREQELQ